MRRLLLSLAALAGAATAFAPATRAQGVAPIVGAWQADLPLPTGVVQTFRFESGGGFHLVQSVSMAGTYRLDGSRLVQSVALPTGTVTDTVTAQIAGDALVFTGTADGGSKTLHRVGTMGSSARPLEGTWAIALGGGLSATYTFAPDGTFRTVAVVGDEQGNYALQGATLRLTSDRTFQIPASSLVAVSGDVLTLTPSNGNAAGARRFHRVAAR